MEKTYWIGRKRAAMAMARAAASAEARLIHYDLAGRYSIKAAASLPFMLPRKGPASEGERTALRLPVPRPGGAFRDRPGPRDRGAPGGPAKGRPMSFHFRAARKGPVLSRDQGVRQGRAVRSAKAALGSVEAVRAFLNSHHESLAGRPLDLAVASEAGLVAVEAAISAAGQEAGR